MKTRKHFLVFALVVALLFTGFGPNLTGANALAVSDADRFAIEPPEVSLPPLIAVNPSEAQGADIEAGTVSPDLDAAAGTSTSSASSGAVSYSKSIYDMKVTIDGTQFQLPCRYDDLLAAGWTLAANSSSPEKGTLSGNQYDRTTLVKGESTLDIELFNLGETSITEADGIVGCLRSSECNFDVDGITNGTAITDVIARLGKPTSIKDNTYCFGMDDWYHRTLAFVTDANGAVCGFEIEELYEHPDFTPTQIQTNLMAQYQAPTALGNKISTPVMEILGTLYQFPCPLGIFIQNGWRVMDTDILTVYQDTDLFYAVVVNLYQGDYCLSLIIRNEDKVNNIYDCAATGIEKHCTMNMFSQIKLSGGLTYAMPITDFEATAKDYVKESDKSLSNTDGYYYPLADYDRDIDATFFFDIDSKQLYKFDYECGLWTYDSFKAGVAPAPVPTKTPAPAAAPAATPVPTVAADVPAPAEAPANPPDSATTGASSVSTYGDFYSGAFKINGKTYRIGDKLSTFVDTDKWTAKRGDPATDVVDPNNMKSYTLTNAVKKTEFDVTVTNRSKTDKLAAKDAKVDYIILETEYVELDIAGITNKTTREQLAAALGAPSSIYESSYDKSSTIKYDFSPLDFSFLFSAEGVLKEVTIHLYSPGNSYGYTISATDIGEKLMANYKAPKALGKSPLDPIVKISGALYQLPAPVLVFRQNGWKFGCIEGYDLTEDVKLPAGKTAYAYFYKGNYCLSVRISNPADIAVGPADCLVISIGHGIFGGSSNNLYADMQFSGGIDLSMTKDAFLAAVDGMRVSSQKTDSLGNADIQFVENYTVSSRDNKYDVSELSMGFELETGTAYRFGLKCDYWPF